MEQLEIYLRTLANGFAAGLSEIESLYYAGSSSTITINSQEIPYYQLLGFNNEEEGKALMELFGLAGVDHDTPRNTAFENGLPRENIFFDSIGDAVNLGHDGKPVFKIDDAMDMRLW